MKTEQHWERSTVSLLRFNLAGLLLLYSILRLWGAVATNRQGVEGAKPGRAFRGMPPDSLCFDAKCAPTGRDAEVRGSRCLGRRWFARQRKGPNNTASANLSSISPEANSPQPGHRFTTDPLVSTLTIAPIRPSPTLPTTP